MQVFFTRLICTMVLATTAFPVFAQLTPEFSSNKNTGCAPFSLVVSFQDNTTGNPTSWLWKFGDAGNSSSTLQNPTFIYSDAGCYDVTLVVSDGVNTDSITKTCFIEVFPQPEPGFTVDVSEGCAPLTVNFTDTSVANAASITNWTYILSDGSNDTLQNPTFTFANAPDTINVALTVVNSNGCQNTVLLTDVIYVAEPPILDFSPDTNAACTGPLAITFTNNSQFNGAVNPVFEWDFPGGTPATFTGANPPVVTYNADGQYDVTLRVSSANGCADTLFQPALIGIGGVTADFTTSNTTICLGDTITFTNTSLGGVSTVEWNFGENAGVDGTGNIEEYVYTTPGVYSVTLRANNIDCGDTLVQTNLITVNAVPTASFTIDRDEDCQTGLPFFFTDASVGATGWSWDFGDTNTSIQQNPQHTYTAFGDFTICLTVTNAQGCTDVFCDTISVQPPQVLFSRTPTEGCAPITTQYTENVNSIDPIVTYAWDFGAGAVPPNSALQNPQVTYPNPGAYNATLTVTTQSGCVGSATLTPSVEVGVPPVSSFTQEDDSVCISEPITFIADSVNPGWDYLWDFQYSAPGNFVLLDDSVTTAYPDTGIFSVALIVDNNGCQDTTIFTDTVSVSPPLASFALSDTVVCSLPASISFTDLSIGPADVFEWYVNDTLIALGQNPPPYVVNSTGSFIFTQILLNSVSGCTDTFSVPVIAGNPIADFTLDNVFGCRALTVNATNTSQNAGVGAWDFDLGDAVPFNSTDWEPTYTYPDTGIYTVQLAIQDALGCRDTLVRTQYVEVVGPYANFGADPQTGCPPLIVTFSDSTATTAATTLTTWAWDFGDGTSGGGQNPTHQYDSAGNYSVFLTVTDDQGCEDSLRIDSFIQVTFPVPDFIVDDDSTCSGDTTFFTNLSTGVGMTYLWDFGDGTTDTAANPAHVFVKPVADSVGFSYDVTLIVTDINGCVDSITYADLIYLEPFDARFGGDPTIGICPPLSTQFFDQSIGNVVGWNWNFGDGIGVSSLQNPANLYITPGLFDVQLIATHENGCQDTLLQQDFIQLAGPNGTYVIDPPQVCLGDTIEITAIVTAADCGAFDFRDGFVVDTCAFTGGTDTLTVEHIYSNPGVYFSYPGIGRRTGLCVHPGQWR